MVYLQAHAESATPTLLLQKTSNLAEVGWARAHLCTTVATPLLSAQQLYITHIVHIQCLRQMQFLIVIVCVFLFLAYLFK